MTRHLSAFILLSLALVAGPQAAAVNPVATANPGLDFELADTHRFIRLSELPAQTTVINFWRADCPPCLREMPLLADLAKAGKVRVVTVAVQRPAETAAAPQRILDALKKPVVSLHAPTEPRGLLARFGNPKGALPHTVVLNAERQPCGQLTGEITPEWLSKTLAQCPLPNQSSHLQ